jgi:hypothetical protein
MKLTRLCATLATLLFLAAWPAASQDKTDAPKVTLKTAKYADLTQAVARERGKVVVVDLWGFF